MKRVVSVWLPSWPISRLRRAVPEAVPLQRPFALVESGAHGLMITAVNDVAAGLGIEPGMALTDVRTAHPRLISRTAEHKSDRLALLKVARWAGRYGPNRHIDGDDGLWIDITGVAHLFGGEAALLNDLTQRLTAFGVSVRAGLADTLGAAHGLARFGCPQNARWALAPQGRTREAIYPLPVEALRLEASHVLLLKRLGLRRVGQLYDIPRDSLARRFSSSDVASAVLVRLDQALGFADEPRRPMQMPPVLSVARVFSEPLVSSEALEGYADELARELAAALAAKGLGARTVRLTFYRADGTTGTITAAMSIPSRDHRHMMMLLKEKFTGVDAGFGVDLMRLDAVRVARRDPVQNGFATLASTPLYDPAALVDRLASRFGSGTVTVLRPRGSYIPERAERRLPALETLAAEDGLRSVYTPPWPYPRGLARPSFLLARPEPIEVMAEVPDGPPVRFIWRRVERRVARAEGPERIAPEWWRMLEGDAHRHRPRTRDYYSVEDQEGARYWVFRQGLYGGEEDGTLPKWFLHGLFA